MDNLTHSLTGLALARAGLNRLSPRATLLLLLSANAPDLDIVAAPWGALRYLETHRGYTHCLLGLPIMAALSVIVTAGIYRQKLPWGRAWIACALGVASHLLLDWTNTYGIRLFLPFSSSWSYGDINQLTDGVLICALLLAAVWPWFSGLVLSEIGDRRAPRGRASAWAVLLFFAVFDFGRFLMHQRATAALASRLYGDEAPVRVAALPSTFNPFRWTGLVETERGFHAVEVNVLQNLDPAAASVLYNHPFDEPIQAALRSEAFRFFVYFARFPVWTEEPLTMTDGPGVRIDLTDLRFGAPNVGAFHCVAVINSRNQVLQSTFTYGSGAAIGRP